LAVQSLAALAVTSPLAGDAVSKPPYGGGPRGGVGLARALLRAAPRSGADAGKAGSGE